MTITLEDEEAIQYMMDKLSKVSDGALEKADEEIVELRKQLQVALAYSKTLEGKKKTKKTKKTK